MASMGASNHHFYNKLLNVIQESIEVKPNAQSLDLEVSLAKGWSLLKIKLTASKKNHHFDIFSLSYPFFVLLSKIL